MLKDGPKPHVPLRPVQSRMSSFAEASFNVSIGFFLSILTQAAVYPFFGIHTSWQTDIRIATIFTAVSVVRSYAMRRLFERFHGS